MDSDQGSIIVHKSLPYRALSDASQLFARPCWPLAIERGHHALLQFVSWVRELVIDLPALRMKS